MVDMDLTRQVGLEVNGLYRRLHFSDGPEVVVTWQIPVLAKFRFSASKASPFVEVGPSFRLTGNRNATDPSHYGITTGAGVEVRLKRLRVAPVLRYTRWAEDGRLIVSPPQTLTHLNQVELLVGFSF